MRKPERVWPRAALVAGVIAATAAPAAGPASAEVSELRIAQQYGIG